MGGVRGKKPSDDGGGGVGAVMEGAEWRGPPTSPAYSTTSLSL